MPALMRSVASVLVVLTAGVLAQQPVVRQWTSVGLWGALGANFHSPDLQTPLGVYSQSATGLGWGIGGAVVFPVSSTLGLGMRAGYEALGADLRSVTGSTLASRIGAVELFPHALVWVGQSRFYVPAGLELGIGTGASVQPPGQTVWQDVPEQALRLAIAAGIGWSLPLSRTTALVSEITLRVPFSDVSSAPGWNPWKVTQARLTLGLFFGIPRPEREEEPAGSAPTVALTVDVPRLRVEEVRWTEYFPLLPYIFFNKASAEPRTEYASIATRGEFRWEELPMDALGVNRSVLDIVGKRMQEYPTARLTLTGTTDGRQEARIAGLPRQRAERIKEYLVTRWGISPERITIVSRPYPEKPSASRTGIAEDRQDGDEENRRVELTTTVPELLMPVMLTAESRQYVQPEVLSWQPIVSSQASIASWELTLSQAGRILDIVRGEGSPPSPLRWRVPAAVLQAGELPLEYLFRVTDVRGRSAQVVGSLPVEYISSFRKRTEQLPDRTVTRFSLILFDFDSDALTPENQSILETLVLPFVRATSTVRIAGYTDRIGQADYNQQLSLRRARRVRDFLAARVPGARYEIAGYGESVPLFDNDSPIGRQLSRTVQITIETPTAP